MRAGRANARLLFQPLCVIKMKTDLEKKVESMLIGILSDGFNRSIASLESCDAINTKEMRKEYKGVGSKYYDMVTRELEYTARHAAPYLVGVLQNELQNNKK